MVANKVTRRLGCELEFDGDREKDVVRMIDTLAGRKDLGHLVSHLLRLAFESPEVYGNGKEVRQLVDKMMEYGTSPTRYKYFETVDRAVEEMKCKIDSIYSMAFKMYMLAEFGKRMGIADKADALLSASFILERQITSLCMDLGVDNLNHTFISNKLSDTKSKADEALEYIIESYSEISNEIVSTVEQNTHSNVQNIQTNQTQQPGVDLKQFKEIMENIADKMSESISDGISKSLSESLKNVSFNVESASLKDTAISNQNNGTGTNDPDVSKDRNEADNEIIELVEKRDRNQANPDEALEIKIPTGDVANQFKAWMLD